MEFYYYFGSEKRGPVNPAQLKALVAAGEIVPETILETGGRRLPASKIKGLSFPAPVPPPVPPAEPAPAARNTSEESDHFTRLLRSRSVTLEKEGNGFFVLAAALVLIGIFAGIAAVSLSVGLAIGGAGFPLYVLGRVFTWFSAYGCFLTSRDR